MKLKRLFFVAFIMMMSFIIGCNDDDGDSSAEAVNPPIVENETREQIAIRLHTPAEPDEELNHSTILGIMGDDDIRDDLNRLIDFALPNNAHARRIFEQEAYLWTQRVKHQNDRQKLIEIGEELDKLYECQSRGLIPVPEELSDFGYEIVSGFARAKLSSKMRRIVRGERRGIVFYNRMPDDVVNQYCDSFK